MDALTVINGMLELFGGLVAFMGPSGFSLFLLTFLLIAMFGTISPLPKLTNYVIVVVVVLGFAAWNGVGLSTLGPYTLVIAMPLLLGYGLKLLRRAPRWFDKLDEAERVERIQNLARQIETEVAELEIRRR